MVKKCNNCGFQQDEFLNVDGRNYCNSCNSEINVSSSQILAQKQKSLHKMKTALDTFYNTLEPLEEYIEKAGYYSNFQSKRQRYRKTIMDSEGPVENDEDLFLSNLYIFAQLTVKGKPEFFREIIRGDFYRWINYTGITADNCPETLKHFLIEINNVLDDKSEKIVAETDRKVVNVEINPKEMVGIFSGLHNPLNESGKQKKELEGKSWNELPEQDRLKGDAELGKQAFEKIERSVSIPHQNFCLRYFGEKRATERLGDMDIDSLRHEVPINQQSISSGNKHSNSLGKTPIPIVITLAIGSVALFGLITYKVKKNKVKN